MARVSRPTYKARVIRFIEQAHPPRIDGGRRTLTYSLRPPVAPVDSSDLHDEARYLHRWLLQRHAVLPRRPGFGAESFQNLGLPTPVFISALEVRIPVRSSRALQWRKR